MDKNQIKFTALYKIFTLAIILWSVFIFILNIWAIKDERKNLNIVLITQVRSFIDQVVATRFWNSIHGGVYVPVNENTQPNPYLKTPRRDITTTDGQKLTLINPAYMTRQIAEIAQSRNLARFNITSLNPIRPENAPTGWEKKALLGFSKPRDEYWEWWLPDDKTKREFRYITPLMTEKSCMSCHGEQGYHEGDIRGGISVTIPVYGILNEQNKHIRTASLQAFWVWILGITGIVSAYFIARREYGKRSALIEQLQKALTEVKTLSGFIPICASCKKVRNDDGYWDQIEQYIRDRSDAQFSHSICPECREKLYPELSHYHANDSKSDQTEA